MLLADVNVFVYAHRVESRDAGPYGEWLAAALTGNEPFGVSEAVLASFLRIVTHHRVYLEPTPLAPQRFWPRHTVVRSVPRSGGPWKRRGSSPRTSAPPVTLEPSNVAPVQSAAACRDSPSKSRAPAVGDVLQGRI